MKRLLKLTAAAAVFAGAAFMSAPAVAGSAQPVPKVTGSVQLSSPLQTASFVAFPATTTTTLKGNVAYTNWELAAPTSGVWKLGSTVPITFSIGGGTYAHTMTVLAWHPLAYNQLAFTASGVYDADHSYTWTGSGTVTGSAFALDLVYTGSNPGYALHLEGTIGSDGTITGTETGSSTGTFVTAAGAASQVFGFTTAVTCASISGTTATFGFTIPIAPLSGTPVVVQVKDLATPATAGDTWSHGVDTAVGACTGSTAPYQITDGNIVVH